jgi:hypothetical protein
MTHAGTMCDLKKVWLNEGGVASVVPLKLLEQIYPVSYHSAKGMNAGHFVIHSREGDIVCRNNSRGMPYLNLEELEAEVALCLIQDTIDTVRTNFEGYTKREIEEAKQAREAQGMLGHPTDREFLGMVRSQMITNCNVTPTAIKNANHIFGPDLAGVRGRTVRTAPEPVRVDYVQIPRTILDRHSVMTLAVDCMFVNGVPFLVSVSRGLNLITAEFTPTPLKIWLLVLEISWPYMKKVVSKWALSLWTTNLNASETWCRSSRSTRRLRTNMFPKSSVESVSLRNAGGVF